MIEEDVRDALVADGAVSAIVGANVFVGHVYSASFPMVQVRSTGGQVAATLKGESGIRNRIMQIDCYALTETDASALAEAARLAVSGTQTGFEGVGLEGPVAQFEDEYRAHRSTFEMSFWF